MLLQSAALSQRRRRKSALSLGRRQWRYAAAQDFLICAAVAKRRRVSCLAVKMARSDELSDMG